MLKMFRTEQDKIKETDRIQSGVWVELINPEEHEAEKIAKALNIEIEDIVASTDPDEKNRIEFINDYTLILVDMPIQEIRHGTTNYTTIPLGIILTAENVVTVCTVESPILSYFHQDHAHVISTKKLIRFIYEILLRNVLFYQKALTEIDKIRAEFERNVEHTTKESDIIRLHELETTLVYFATGLRGSINVLYRLKRYRQFKQYPEDEELLDDIIIENQQAIEMTDIYRTIIDGTKQLISSVMDNRLNQVMKQLTSITIILSVPTIVSGMYGMNVNLDGMPLAKSLYGFGAITVMIVIVSLLLYYWLKKKDMM